MQLESPDSVRQVSQYRTYSQSISSRSSVHTDIVDVLEKGEDRGGDAFCVHQHPGIMFTRIVG